MSSTVAIMAILSSAAYAGQPSCATPDGSCEQRQSQKDYSEKGDDNLKIPAFPYHPIIGTRNNDAKTVYDTGVGLKIYIASYKDNKKVLVAAHDRYVVARESGFVNGVDKPEPRRRTGMMTPAGKVPFVFGAGEIDEASIKDNAKIKEYLEAIAESEKRETIAFENLESADNKFDNTIKKYLDKTKEK